MTLSQQLESYLDIAGWEDALGLSNHPLQPVLIDCVEEINDGSFWETQFPVPSLSDPQMGREPSPSSLEEAGVREGVREREREECVCVYERE